MSKTINIFHGIPPNGDTTVGDYLQIMDRSYTNIIWSLTESCNLGCPYCCGQKSRGHPASLLDIYNERQLADAVERVRDMGRKVYVTLTGGEPTLVNGLLDLCQELGKRHIKVVLLSNMTTIGAGLLIRNVDPTHMIHVRSTYHAWHLDHSPKSSELFFNNINDARGITTTIGVIATPENLERIDELLNSIRKHTRAPVLVKNYLDWPGGYPFRYTEYEKQVLRRVQDFDQTLFQLMWRNAGHFNGMRCDAGRGFVRVYADGRVVRCPALQEPLGHLVKGFTLKTDAERCTMDFCTCPQTGMQYGVDPWNFIEGAQKKDFTFCRFGP